MMTLINKKNKSQKGFTLIEMAIGMVIVSLLISFAVVAFSGLLRRGFEKNTFKDMEIIADAIAIYTQKHMRVPCPADPNSGGIRFGIERGAADTDGNGLIDSFGQCNTLDLAEGIVPFATLGLPQRLARDRFGNFITYRVSLTSAQRPTDSNNDARLFNNWCMTRPYWYSNEDTDGDGTADTETYTNLAKAAFCCGTWNPNGVPAALSGPAGDITVQGSFGALPNLSRANTAAPLNGGTPNEYRTRLQNQPTYANLLNTQPPTFPAYILVSHGENGFGAFTGNGTARIVGATGPELENANGTTGAGDSVFFASDRLAGQSPGGGGQTLFRPDIDDIVYWQTPMQIVGRIGGMSCMHP